MAKVVSDRKDLLQQPSVTTPDVILGEKCLQNTLARFETDWLGQADTPVDRDLCRLLI